MVDCERSNDCPFFNNHMAEMPAIAGILKRKYCQGGHRGCARYMVADALGGNCVPENLFPNMGDRALTLISEHSACATGMCRRIA